MKGLTVICSIATLPLGYYAFFNPDNPAWYGEIYDDDGVITPRLFADPTDILDKWGRPLVDIHGRFVTWFTYGFILMLTPFISVLGGIFMKDNQCIRNFINKIGWGSFWLFSFIWGLIGYFCRFSYPFMYASGDAAARPYMDSEEYDAWKIALKADDSLYQARSGFFMYILVIIVVF